MKKKILAFTLIMLLILTGSILLACGEDAGGNDLADTDLIQDEEGDESGDEIDGENESDFKSLAAKASKIESFSYEEHYSFSHGEEYVSKMWIKRNMIRNEVIDSDSDELAVSIIDTETGSMYIYYPESNFAMVMDVDYQVLEENLSLDNFYDTEELDNAIFLRQEVYEGKNCAVFEAEDYDGAGATLWIWQDYGIPVKIETSIGEETMLIEFKNIELNKVSDSIFELPSDVEIMDFSGAVG